MNRFKLVLAFTLFIVLSSCRTETKTVVAEEKLQFAAPSEVGMIADSLAQIEAVGMVMIFVPILSFVFSGYRLVLLVDLYFKL